MAKLKYPLAPVLALTAQYKAKGVLSAVQAQGDKNKVRKYPERHHQRLHPLKRAEENKISHKGKKGLAEPGGQLMPESADNIRVQPEKQRQYGHRPQ